MGVDPANGTFKSEEMGRYSALAKQGWADLIWARFRPSIPMARAGIWSQAGLLTGSLSASNDYRAAENNSPLNEPNNKAEEPNQGQPFALASPQGLAFLEADARAHERRPFLLRLRIHRETARVQSALG
jgi:hypothetical protein